MKIYAGLLASDASPDDDPCWERAEWADALKTDCVFRLGACNRHLDQPTRVLACFQQYTQLLGLGRQGSYTIGEVAAHTAALGGKDRAKLELKVKDAIGSTFRAANLKPVVTRGREARRRPFGEIGNAVLGYAAPADPV